jgi:glucose 1-dehydrogenase
MRLEGKRALVTGSSKGIGQAIAKRLGQDGADVIVNYNSDSRGAEETVSEIQKTGRRAQSIKGDLGVVSSVQALIDQAWEALGGLDILVNNAGIEISAPFWDVTEADYDKVLNVNLKGVFFATQAFVRKLRADGRGGKVINVSSVHEDLPFPTFASYCASKGGLKMLTRNLAIELGPLGITINSIAPGAIETPINAKLLNDPEKLRALHAQIPLGRLGKTNDVAGLAAYLASSDADYATGATFTVDGGLTWFYQE